MIGEREIRHYQEQGYIVVPNLLDEATIALLRERTDFYLESARGKPTSDAVHDIEDSHRPDAPRVRRIKDPCSLDGLFHATARHPAILAVVANLLGPDLRYHHSKINIKAAGYGSHRTVDEGYNSKDNFDAYRLRVQNIFYDSAYFL